MSKGSKNGRQENALDKLREKFSPNQNGAIADWATCDAPLLLEAIAAVAYRGGALRFGYSRDGGAYAIGVYLSDDRFTVYVRPSEDIDEYLRTLIESVAHLPPA